MRHLAQDRRDGGVAERNPRHQPLVTVVVALAVGIVLSRYGRPEMLSAQNAMPIVCWVWWSTAAACAALWWVCWRRSRDAVGAWLLLAAVALAGAAWHDVRWHVFTQGEIGRFGRATPQPACVEAVAREAPRLLPTPRPTALRPIPAGERSRLTVDLIGVRDGTSWRPADGTCLLLVDGRLTGVRAGDRLQVFAQLQRLSPPQSPGEFDRVSHGRADRQLATLRSAATACVTPLEARRIAILQSILDSVRAKGKRLVERFVGTERAALASAVLLGAREGMPSEESASYMITGTIHLLVVSGLHVGILALGLYGPMRLGWVPRRMALATVVAVVVIYALVADARPPVVRAAVLITLLCVAAWNGRRGIAFNSLAAAAIVILALNPADLFRVGPQLSFLAVATLAWNHHRLARWLRLERDRLEEVIAAARPWYERAARRLLRWAVRLAAATAAIWLASLPLVLYRFHVATPVAPLISPLVWLLILMALWSGFLMLLCGWLLPPLGAILGAVCDLALSWLEAVVHWAGSWTIGHAWLPGPAWWWVLGFYVGLVAVMFWGGRLVAPRWQVAVLCGWIVVGVVPPLARAAVRDGLDVSFLAVGHGTCVVVEGPDGETLLYDAGALGSPQSATQTVAGYLWHCGKQRIDAIVLSHADVDHYNAVPGLLERFSVGAVYVSPVMFDGFGSSADSEAPAELRAAIDAAGVPIHEIWAGDRLRVGNDVTVDVLHPPRKGVLAGDNADSIALVVEYDGRRVLLPGDLEAPGLDDLMAELPLDCDLLMAPHHGSRRSDPPGLSAWSTPEWVVVSGGGSRDVGLVTRTYEAAGARVLGTYHHGTVILSVRDGEMSASTSSDLAAAASGHLSSR